MAGSPVTGRSPAAVLPRRAAAAGGLLRVRPAAAGDPSSSADQAEDGEDEARGRVAGTC